MPNLTLAIRLKIFRWGTPVLIAVMIGVFVCLHTGGIEFSISDLILGITAVLLIWYAGETFALVELTRIKEQPFLEIYFQNGNAKVSLTNLGSSPAYSPTITSLEIDDDVFDFDPLGQSKWPILANETRDIWVHHKDKKTNRSFAHSLPVLWNALSKYPQLSFEMLIQYFDKDGVMLKRKLYLKANRGLFEKDQYIYTSTIHLEPKGKSGIGAFFLRYCSFYSEKWSSTGFPRKVVLSRKK